MRVSYGGRATFGMPGVGYTTFERTSPLVRTMPSPVMAAAMAGYGAFDQFDMELGDYGAPRGIATARNIARQRKRIDKFKREVNKQKKALRAAKTGGQKRRANRRLKRAQRRLKRAQARLRASVARLKKQVRRRRQKGKKLTRRQKRAIASSKAARKQQRRIRKGLRSDVPPAWFKPNESQAVRYNQWRQLSLKRRKVLAKKAARARRLKRQRAQSGGGGGGGAEMSFMEPPSSMPEDGFTPQDAFSVSPTSTGYPTAMPEFVESDTGRDDGGDDEEDDGDEEEAAAPMANRNLIIGAIAVAAIGGLFLATRKKKSARSRPT